MSDEDKSSSGTSASSEEGTSPSPGAIPETEHEPSGVPPPWRSSKAKELLREDILAKLVTEDMEAQSVFDMRPEYRLYKFNNFKTNLKNLLEACKNPKKRKWATSVARHLLKEDIINGRIKDGMDPTEVYQGRPEFQQFPFKNFKTNFENLMQNILLQFDRLQSDCDAFGHDLAIIEEIRRDAPVATPWHKSEARKLLRRDVEGGKHHQLWPIEMYQSEAAYREFSLEVFRNHIYQERDRLERKEHRFKKKQERSRHPAGIISQAPTRSEKEKRRKRTAKKN